MFDTQAQTPATQSSGARAAARVATLAEPTASFGAVADGGWLYVYGGHVARTHSYSKNAVSGRFNRLNLASLAMWEALPGGPPLQGMNLAVNGGKIYRVGGMQPQNDTSEILPQGPGKPCPRSCRRGPRTTSPSSGTA